MQLSGYSFERLRDDGEFVLYRGRGKQREPRSLLLLSPATTRPSPETLEKIDHEYSLRSELNPSWAVRPLALSEQGGQKALVLDDPGGDTLDKFLWVTMEMRQLLSVAAALATALAGLHGKQLIHKDVKPANVLVNPATGQVRLTGFGIASRLRRERQAPEPPEFIAGTLPYMAPEQTGRMNRSIDSRSDLYALGVTLYEMLTGELPFAASDPLEWVHCHIARHPVPPHERVRCVPPSISAIVMKLLAKTPEERYQTASGVESDLRCCLADLEAHGRIADFVLGQHDAPGRLLVPEKLYGREREIETLLAAFNRVVEGRRPELVLVSGYSGIGKSAVVNELHKPLVPPRGLFASGKFDQYKRDIPYATLAQAFQGLIRPLLSKSEEELGKWRDSIQDALEPNGQLMVSLVPELKAIIGEQPPVPELPQREAQARFQLVFRRFINVFARPEHPLALFLDDLQWLDAATLELMEYLLTQPDIHHLMLIGAYRDNEVDATHPLVRKLQAMRQAGALLREIALAPLTRRDLERLIADSLRCEPEHARPLAELAHDRTSGNPFFAIQFVSALFEEGLLTFDHVDGRWSWDPNRIHAKGYTDNVVDLMAGKLTRLAPETQNALKQLACLGNTAEFTTLGVVYHDSMEEMHARLEEAVRAGYISRVRDSYHFLHDRVQEAAYSLIPQESRAEAHLRIGMSMASHTPPDRLKEEIFEIVNQLNRATHLIASAAERERVACLNLIAGRRAKSSAAYASALKYLQAGWGLLTEETWDRKYDLAFSIQCLLAECELLTTDMAAADNRLAMLAVRAKGAHDIALVARLRLTLYTAFDRSERAVEVFLEFWRDRGVEWSAHPTEEEVLRAYDHIWAVLGSRQIEELVDLPLIANLDVLDALDVLSEVVTPAMWTDAGLHALVICRMVSLTLEYGNSDGSCYAYVWLGMLAGPRFGNYQAGFRFGKLGYELVERRGLQRYQARTYMCFGSLIIPWTKHVKAGRELQRRCFDAARRVGDLTYAAYSRQVLITNLLAAGDPLAEVQREAETGLEFTTNVQFGFVIDAIAAQVALIRTLRGLTAKFGAFNDERFDELRFERHFAGDPVLEVPQCWYWIRKLQARFLAGDYSCAIEASLNAEPLLGKSPSVFEVAEYHFYSALSRAAACDSATDDARERHFEALAGHQKQQEIWAQHCPENFENRAALVGAEIARIEGRVLEAECLYEQAIRSAHGYGFVNSEAIAYELAARFYAARGFGRFADAYWVEARYCYRRWGAEGKVAQLEELCPQLKREWQTTSATSSVFGPAELLDVATVIKVSQAVSGQIVTEGLIDSLMRTALEHAGADRGLLVVPRGDDLVVKAEVTTRGGDVPVRQPDTAVSAAKLPESLVRYVMRTQESVILEDSCSENPFSADPYIAQYRPRSVLTLPLIRQGKLISILHLENSLTPHVFTPGRIAVLKVLASQAAISLENTRLYRDLESREARFRRLFDANIMGVFIWNLDGHIVGCNQAFLDMLQYGHEEVSSGRVRWTTLTPPEWSERDERALADLRATGIVQPFEKEYWRKDGSRAPVLVAGALFEKGGEEGVAFALDLSEQKRAEESLRRSEANLAEAQKLSRTGSWHWKVGSGEVAWSQEFFAIFGFAPEKDKPSYQLSLERIHPEDRSRIEEARWAAIRNRQQFEAEYRVRLLDGSIKYVRGIGHCLEDQSGDVEYIGAVMDVTERKRAEEERERLREEQRVIVETANDVVLSADESGAIRFANPATSRVFGFDPKELIGKPLTVLMPDVMRRRHERGFRRYLATGQRHINWNGTQLTGLHKNGQEFPVEISFGELTKNGHRVFTGFIRDITDRKRAEEERKKATEALMAAHEKLARAAQSATLGELAASIAHEINQPLAAVVANGDACVRWLSAAPANVERARAAAERIARDGRSAAEFVRRIRGLFRHATPEKDALDIEEVVAEVIRVMKDELVGRGAEIRTAFPSELPRICADRIQIQQVVINLVRNALDAMEGLSAERKVVEIGGRLEDGESVAIEVLDRGCGIEDAEKVFLPFFTTKRTGMGVGLSICRSIVEAHGGRLRAVRNEGGGSRFIVSLPADKGASETQGARGR